MGFIDYKQLARLEDAKRYTALKQAIDLELSLPQMGVDMGLSKASPTVQLLNRQPAALPTLDRIKGYLATKYATPSDNPILTDVAARVETFFHTNMPEVDLGWSNFFQLVDLRGTNQDSFDIIDTNAGIVFTQTAPGESITIKRTVAESKLSVPFVTYRAGLGILDEWLRFQKWWNIEQAIAEFRAQHSDVLAKSHYSLFTSQGSGINQAFDTDDTVTFNAGAAAILRGLRSKGFSAGQGAQFWILCAAEKVGRILKMLEATQGSPRVAFSATAEPIAYTVAGVVSSTYVPADDSGYYLVLPNRKLQRGVWDDLSVESKRDIYAGAEDWVGTCRFNAAIGETLQVRRVLYV